MQQNRSSGSSTNSIVDKPTNQEDLGKHARQDETDIMTNTEMPQPGKTRSLVARAKLYISKQTEAIHLRLGVAQILLRLIPYGTMGNLRSMIYGWCGFDISSKAYIAGALELRGDGDIYPHLHVGEHTFINTPCFIELNAPVHIGAHVGIGHHTVFVTSNHELGPASARMGKLKAGPITIGDGAWIGAGAMILPGVTIGPGAFVTAGAVVTRDVPANAKVAGVHARITSSLDGRDPALWQAMAGNSAEHTESVQESDKVVY